MGGLWLATPALAFEQDSPTWTYMANPMGEPWVICPDGMPDEAVQRTKDGASAWNYERFRYTFANEACLSDGRFPTSNGVNQIDFGPLPAGELARTATFFVGNDALECDLRFNSAVQWYTGTGTPSPEQFDWWSVATHEMGHCLGLDHEDDVLPPPVMRSGLLRGAVLRTLTADDIAGRNSIYGQSQGNSGPGPLPLPAIAASDNGGGGGCSLTPGSTLAAPALLAALGNICLPVVVLVFIRLWARWRAW
jgi:hypothetical protein